MTKHKHAFQADGIASGSARIHLLHRVPPKRGSGRRLVQRQGAWQDSCCGGRLPLPATAAAAQAPCSCCAPL